MRDGCHLCETFIDELEAYNRTWSRQMSVQDVDSSDEWIREYGDRVPALVIDGKLVCEYFFDPAKVSAYSRD